MANKKQKNKFPGYPHYPASEDIMNSKDNGRVEMDVENLSRSKDLSTPPDKSVRPPQAEKENTKPVLGDVDDDSPKISDADLTDEDLIALDERENQYENAEVLTGEDLDVPGAEEDDENEEIGEEDEENNYYSLGGDAHENLEEDQA